MSSRAAYEFACRAVCMRGTLTYEPE